MSDVCVESEANAFFDRFTTEELDKTIRPLLNKRIRKAKSCINSKRYRERKKIKENQHVSIGL